MFALDDRWSRFLVAATVLRSLEPDPLSAPLSSALPSLRNDRKCEQLRQSWVSTDGWRRRKGVDDMPSQLVRAVGTEAIGGHHGREPPPH